MRLLAGILTGAAVMLLVAQLTGAAAPLPPRRPARPRPSLGLDGISAPARLWAGASGIGVVTLLVLWGLTGSVLVAVAPAALAAAVPAGAQRSKERKAAKERIAAWPDALRSALAALGAGRSPHDALVELARTGPVPLRPAFARYQSLAQHVGEAEALAIVRDELAHPLSDRIFEVLIVTVENGSRVAATILREVADSTTADIHLAERLDTAQTEQRINSRVVLVVPSFVLVVLCSRPGPIRDFYASADGIPVLLVGTAMTLAGALIVGRLARLPAEPRVVLDRQITEEAP